MPYNAHAESFGSSSPSAVDRFHRVYSDIADATPCHGEWRAVALIGRLPSLSHFAPKSQAEILRVVIRDMQALPAEADGLKRVRGGVYQWRFSKEPA